MWKKWWWNPLAKNNQSSRCNSSLPLIGFWRPHRRWQLQSKKAPECTARYPERNWPWSKLGTFSQGFWLLSSSLSSCSYLCTRPVRKCSPCSSVWSLDTTTAYRLWLPRLVRWWLRFRRMSAGPDAVFLPWSFLWDGECRSIECPWSLQRRYEACSFSPRPNWLSQWRQNRLEMRNWVKLNPRGIVFRSILCKYLRPKHVPIWGLYSITRSEKRSFFRC